MSWIWRTGWSQSICEEDEVEETAKWLD